MSLVVFNVLKKETTTCYNLFRKRRGVKKRQDGYSHELLLKVVSMETLTLIEYSGKSVASYCQDNTTQLLYFITRDFVHCWYPEPLEACPNCDGRPKRFNYRL